MLPSPAGQDERRAGQGFDDDAGAAGEVSGEALGKRVISGRRVPAGCETAPSRRR